VQLQAWWMWNGFSNLWGFKLPLRVTSIQISFDLQHTNFIFPDEFSRVWKRVQVCYCTLWARILNWNAKPWG